ncbi:MAG: hypothetical protein ACTHU0_33590, partial [Kofleriaceae bacterium]
THRRRARHHRASRGGLNVALQTQLKRIAKARKALDTEVAKLTAKKIAAALGALVPDGCVLTWTQYVPSFNDGEPCTFTVGEAYVESKAGSSAITLEHGNPARLEWAGLTRKAWTDLRRAFREIPEEVLESAFGIGVLVVIESGGNYRIDDYNCGY